MPLTPQEAAFLVRLRDRHDGHMDLKPDWREIRARSPGHKSGAPLADLDDLKLRGYVRLGPSVTMFGGETGNDLCTLTEAGAECLDRWLAAHRPALDALGVEPVSKPGQDS